VQTFLGNLRILEVEEIVGLVAEEFCNGWHVMNCCL
jgi:hypothetical protein